ncbi:hypothetical protein P9112_009130 [Eukaryota sp. TZLM1-RC]
MFTIESLLPSLLYVTLFAHSNNVFFLKCAMGSTFSLLAHLLSDRFKGPRFSARVSLAFSSVLSFILSSFTPLPLSLVLRSFHNSFSCSEAFIISNALLSFVSFNLFYNFGNSLLFQICVSFVIFSCIYLIYVKFFSTAFYGKIQLLRIIWFFLTITPFLSNLFLNQFVSFAYFY